MNLYSWVLIYTCRANSTQQEQKLIKVDEVVSIFSNYYFSPSFKRSEFGKFFRYKRHLDAYLIAQEWVNPENDST